MENLCSGSPVERWIRLSADSLDTAAALAANARDPYVLYENRGDVCWAEGERAVVTANSRGATLSVGGRRREFAGSPLDTIAKALKGSVPGEWRAYGWVSFELSHLLHGKAANAEGATVAHLMIPSREIRFDDGFALLRAGDEAELDALEKRLLAAASAGRRPVIGERLTVDVDGDDVYLKAVAEAVAHIRGGYLDKVILSREVEITEDVDFAATYLAGRRGNDPARSFLLRLGGWETAGFSPEIVARVTATGDVITQPLAGTRAFEGKAAIDLARRNELYRDAKEVFEHAISVRLAVAELAGVCEPGSVCVEDFMSVKERGSVQHLASEIIGRLARTVTPWDALAALFPAVTASGIPKAAACDLIHEVEPGSRGLYSGAVLTVDSDGTIDAALVLRSVFRKDGRTWLRAGAGIVAQSDPERELEETCEKLRSVSRFLVPPGTVRSDVA
jgi:salicylate synthetase